MAQGSADDPVVLDRADRFDGDDIVVEPAAPHARSRRVRLAAGAVVAAAVLVAGITAAVATRDQTHSARSSVRTVTPPYPRPAHATPPAAAHKRDTRPVRPLAPAPITKTPVVYGGTPASSVAHQNAPPSGGTTPPSVATPPVEPTSVLEWSAAPSTLSVKGGAQMGVTVTVVNPTNGTVTLGTPLSCPPTVRGPRGAIIGGTLCAQITQTLAPHSRLTQRYTLYATDTGIANGKALAAGTYTATVENQFKLKVNVT
ncbi:MAG TPA: hypothetical protein VK771_03565, partial [Acidimicrobiia bacterium]|nr:hypothetical protein [Acidimicrobiia bacterium]